MGIPCTDYCYIAKSVNATATGVEWLHHERAPFCGSGRGERLALQMVPHTEKCIIITRLHVDGTRQLCATSQDISELHGSTDGETSAALPGLMESCLG